MVVSPTCGECLKGASEVSEQVAEINQGRTVPLYVMWVPRRGGREKDVPAATRVIADTSAHEFWDGNDLLGMEYKQVLGWSGNAWDVYLVYGCHAALNSRTDAPYFSALSAFSLQIHCTEIADICSQIADDVCDKVCPRFECKKHTNGRLRRGCLGRGAPQGICDPSLGRASQTQFRKHRRSGKSTGLEPQYSLQTPATVPATASDLFPTSLEARSQAG